MGAIELKRWRDAMIADSGDLLINAYKRWIGPIKTPFNKHDLMASLEAYLRKPDTQRLVVDLMDREDRLVAAVLHFGGDMDASSLERFVDGKASRGRIAGAHITILRERLVIYAYKDVAGRELISIVPALRDCLGQVLSPDDLIGAGEALRLDDGAQEAPPAVPTAPGAPLSPSSPVSPASPASPESRNADPFAAFCALVSCGVHCQPAFKNLSVPVKKAAAMLAHTAPGLVSGGEAMKSAIQALIRAGAFVVDTKGRPMADPQAFIDICEAAGRLAPAYLVVADSELPCPPAMAAAGAVAVLTALPSGLALAPVAMERVAGVVLLRQAGTVQGHAATGVSDADDVRSASRALDADGAIQLAGVLAARFTEAGLLCGFPVGYLAPTSAAAAFVQLCMQGSMTGQGKSSIVVEGSHEIRILPEASPAVRAYIASVARLESTGTVWTATLDRAAAMAAYSFGFTAEAVAIFLETHSGRSLPQGFRFSLDAWEAEARAVRVRTGIVVSLDGHLASILDHAPGASALVREKLGEGVYLLAARDLESAGKALAAAGIPVDLRGEVLAATRQASRLEGQSWRPDASFGSSAVVGTLADTESLTEPGVVPAAGTRPLAFSSDSCKLEKEPSQVIDRLLSRIDEMDLSGKARTELADRVQARLILSDDQLDVAVGSRYTGGEISAGALDYQGKNRLVEASLKSGFVIELIWTDPAGLRCTTRGVPVDISRSPGLDMVSVMDHRTRSVVSLPLGAVTWIRRIPST